MRFGEYLKTLRTEKDLSLRNLAKNTEYDVGYLSRIERSIMLPPLNNDFIEKISQYLSLTDNEERMLSDLAVSEKGKYPDDIKDELIEITALPILLRTINNKKLSDEQVRELAERINEEYK